ncbi:hypothetical protein [Methylobacterium isbiliense]|jgi:hypothetical protein|nr:hypothetical protein [Methylobacterium isbiliense]MDN3621725.1 hypothetical protein [Methylobacterium isbiliense]GJE33640.1 hypothetical protein LDDCCGHA_3841 [Methylobacterium oxalidis]
MAPEMRPPLPAPGRYCAPGMPDITIGPGPDVGIDLMDCRHATIPGGRVRAARCYGMGGAEVPYDVDLVVRSDGALEHDGTVYSRPCGAKR